MKNRIIIAFMGVSLCVTASSCSDDDKVVNNDTPLEIEMTSSDLAVADKCNDFGFRLLNEVSGKNSTEANIIVSPISVNYAFSMLANGAKDESREQIINTLGYQAVDIDEVNAFNKKMTSQLGRIDADVTLNFANSIWANPRVAVKEEFNRVLAENYDAETKVINTESFVNDINSWCASKTNGKIAKFMNESEGIPEFALYNAVYFKGMWNHSCKFDSKNTVSGYFNNADGSRYEVKYMKNTGSRYIETENTTGCELNFGNKSFRAAFLLPNEGVDIASAIDGLANDEWQQIQKIHPMVTVKLSLPKFKVEQEINLVETLCDMGMTDVFYNGDFSYITDSPLSIDRSKQRVIFEINEEGAEAAAVTGIGGATSPGPGETVELTFDRPFIYAVYEQSTGAILFAGVINSFAN